MKFTVILALLVVCVSAQQDSTILNPKGCGKRISDHSVSKIYGGSEAIVGDFSWQVGIIYMGNHNCGGALINSQWVLAIANWLHGYLTPERYVITLGTHNRRNPESWSETRNVTKIIIHEKYHTLFKEYNIALMKLDRPVNFTKYISPACIPTYTRTYVGQKAITTGWGVTGPSPNGEFSVVLMQVELPVLTDARCKDKFRITNPYYNPETELCAGESRGGKGACNGDFGSPLVARHEDSEDSERGQWNLIGLAAYYTSHSCTEGNAYQRVSYFYDWILNKIRLN